MLLSKFGMPVVSSEPDYPRLGTNVESGFEYSYQFENGAVMNVPFPIHHETDPRGFYYFEKWWRVYSDTPPISLHVKAVYTIKTYTVDTVQESAVIEDYMSTPGVAFESYRKFY